MALAFGEGGKIVGGREMITQTNALGVELCASQLGFRDAGVQTVLPLVKLCRLRPLPSLSTQVSDVMTQSASGQIDHVLIENRLFPPNPEFTRKV